MCCKTYLQVGCGSKFLTKSTYILWRAPGFEEDMTERENILWEELITKTAEPGEGCLYVVLGEKQSDKNTIV